MARNIIGVIIGIVAAGLATYFVQCISTGLFPLPPDLDPKDFDAMKAHVATLPPLAFIIVLVAHFVGALVGALTSAKIASTHHMTIAMFVGGFMLAMGILNLVTIPHPIWFMIVDMFVYLPGAYLGYRIYLRYFPNQAA